MNFLELVNKRQSVRKYLPDPIDSVIIERCIEAARLAPSACNSQPWKFVVVDEPEPRQIIAKACYGKLSYFNRFAQTAPVIVAIVIEKSKVIAQIGGRIVDKDFYLFDIGIAATHFCIQAAEEGLGTCMIGWFDEKLVKKILEIPDNKKVGLLITLGYPPKDYKQRIKIRKPLDKIMSRNKY
jgi:nitroreductase